ncbi:hypothetical protein B0H63DRAFT_548825 [Podospora didyma]|uniref:NACHT domain-containing protein n=1 Tax=Podospora didyma TaxID=330526 RepID=A0AAE0KE86_9PEZI|nr:hypothetical protein B0H63DRAFT_548825 [Podospora didyma]
MRFVNTVLLLATASVSLVSAGDVCPGTYCQIGTRCGYDPDGPHCCGTASVRDVLQCVGGVWQVRNTCNDNQFCTCTGSKDLICRTNSKLLANITSSDMDHHAMDPFAALVFNFASGLVAEDEQLGFVMAELTALTNVALKCQGLAHKILDILEQSKAKNLHSFRYSAAAALRSKWNKEEKEELKREVDECQRLLHLHLTLVMQSNTVGTLKTLIEKGQANAEDMDALRKSVGALKKGVGLANIGPEAEAQTRGLLNLSNAAILSVASHRVLDNLWFPELNKRYDMVGSTLAETFEWIFRSSYSQRNQKALEGRMLFRTWLESGEGVFHIAGKPGSGKSTLMKFSYKHGETERLLTSCRAMMQTILYEILKQCPDLISSVFPCQWVEVNVESLRWQATSPPLDISDDDIRVGFSRLDLTRLLTSWVRATLGNLKICVSSREFDVFSDAFLQPQSLKLQDMTYDHIHIFVRERLCANKNFLGLDKPAGGEEKLIGRVIEDSSGVFLWVTLVVKLLDEACNDAESFEALETKIESLPRELEELFLQLL